METKGNYALIGAFTLAGLVGIVAAFLMFAQLELDQQFAYYDIRFSSVSGLSNASDVRFSGLPVGQVVDVRLSPQRDGTVTVRVEVDAATPVREDSVATIESLGVTGVSFVAIGPGTPETELLSDASGAAVPEITAGRSTLQTLTEDAPELISETLEVVREIGDLFRGENADRVDRILANADTASEEFADTIRAFSDVATTVDDFARQINTFNETLDSLTTEMNVVLSSADDTLNSIDTLAEEATLAIQNGTGAVTALEEVLDEAQVYIAEELTQTTDDARAMIATIRTEAEEIGGEAETLLTTLTETGATATARLAQVEETLVEANTLIGTLDRTATTIETAAARIDDLLETEGAPLLAETRAAVASATETIDMVRAATETDLPAVVDDITLAVAEARSMIETVGEDLTTASGDVTDLVAAAESTLTQVSETFADANEALSAVTTAMEAGERTLAVAETTLTGADELIRGDMGALVGDLRSSVEGLEAALATVAEDLPAVSADVRSASAAALEAFADLHGLVSSSSPQVQAFISESLPLFGRLAQETRDLISNLDSVTRQIDRSPTQFLLDRDLPDFRR